MVSVYIISRSSMNKIIDRILEFFGLKGIVARAKGSVDVTGKLDELALENGQGLNWRESVVDLLTLVGINTSIKNRIALAIELECPAELMKDSAKMNEWLRKAILQKLAENGGNVPAELLD